MTTKTRSTQSTHYERVEENSNGPFEKNCKKCGKSPCICKKTIVHDSTFKSVPEGKTRLLG